MTLADDIRRLAADRARIRQEARAEALEAVLGQKICQPASINDIAHNEACDECAATIRKLAASHER